MAINTWGNVIVSVIIEAFKCITSKINYVKRNMLILSHQLYGTTGIIIIECRWCTRASWSTNKHQSDTMAIFIFSGLGEYLLQRDKCLVHDSLSVNQPIWDQTLDDIIPYITGRWSACYIGNYAIKSSIISRVHILNSRKSFIHLVNDCMATLLC